MRTSECRKWTMSQEELKWGRGAEKAWDIGRREYLWRQEGSYKVGKMGQVKTEERSDHLWHLCLEA